MTDHDFQPVAGHPDDDECTYRSDGTDATYCGPHARRAWPVTTHTPRRTIRMSDEEWNAGHAKARQRGETLTEVMRRLLAGYLVSDSSGLDYGVEYRAVPKDADSSLAVDGITGSLEEVRRLYPAKHWHLEERTVSPYKSASRRTRA